jgi:hypothetical protein
MTFSEASERPELTFRKALPAYAVIHQVAPVHASPHGTGHRQGPTSTRAQSWSAGHEPLRRS